jgi:hypothetical protein
MSFLVLPGTTVVFIATWLYMEATPPRPSAAVTAPEDQPAELYNKSLLAKILHLLSPNGRLRHIGLGSATIFTLIIISSLTARQTQNAAPKEDASLEPVQNFTTVPVLESPFKNTLAYVRWNSKHGERIPLIENGYSPFFHTVHYSMPGIAGNSSDFHNLTHDAWKSGYFGYQAVRNTMQTILDTTAEDEITGMFFFHFDVWIEPMGFAEMDFNKIWYPDSENPKFLCMKDTKRYKDWWAWEKGFHEKGLQASRIAYNMYKQYKIDPEEWCTG